MQLLKVSSENRPDSEKRATNSPLSPDMEHLALENNQLRPYFEGQFPVFLGLEGHDLIVPLHTEPQRGCLTGAVGYHTVVQACVFGLCVCMCVGVRVCMCVGVVPAFSMVAIFNPQSQLFNRVVN